nr:MAG TPA: hypothetical protein [Caudoviricetes sp.]
MKYSKLISKTIMPTIPSTMANTINSFTPPFSVI